jgi:hypothetical protein
MSLKVELAKAAAIVILNSFFRYPLSLVFFYLPVYQPKLFVLFGPL